MHDGKFFFNGAHKNQLFNAVKENIIMKLWDIYSIYSLINIIK